jgi:hypothetical protein
MGGGDEVQESLTDGLNLINLHYTNIWKYHNESFL